MQKYIVAALISMFSLNPALGQSSEALKSVGDEIKCFVSKEMPACLNVLAADYSFATQLQVAWMACEAKSAAACARLLGFFEVPERNFSAEEKAKGVAFASNALAECTPNDGACTNLRQAHARVRAALDPNAAECRLEIFNLGTLTEPEANQKTTPLGRFVDQADCTAQCLLLTGREAKEGRKFVRCFFKDKKTEPLKLLGFENRTVCDEKPFDPGENQFFSPCYCQNKSHPAVNEFSLDHGFLAEGAIGTGRRFLKENGYRCAIRFVRIDKDSAKDPSCAKKLADFKAKLALRSDVKAFELNLKLLDCGKVP